MAENSVFRDQYRTWNKTQTVSARLEKIPVIDIDASSINEAMIDESSLNQDGCQKTLPLMMTNFELVTKRENSQFNR